MKQKNYSFIYIVGGLINILAMVIFSKAFTNTNLSSWSPVIFSTFGIVSIMLWGLAYLSVATKYEKAPLLTGVFTIEKAIYGFTWIAFLVSNWGKLDGWFSEDLFTGLFLALYGINDLLFMLLFGWIFLSLVIKKRS